MPGQYDQIDVAGKLTLGGALELSLIDGFTPVAGQTFDILSWGSVAGAFSRIVLPVLDGLVWDASQLSAGELSVAAPAFEDADFDEDGDVDGDDLAQWHGDFGANDLSDADDDGDSDGADFLAWQQQLGSGAPTSGAAAVVPEPAALRITASLIAWLIVGRRRLTV